jgi:nitrogenase molybdenum-iron protein alpha/beta subunit
VIVHPSDALAKPDGFIGAVYALEGIEDAATILNAPTGCKMFLSRTVEIQYPREFDCDEMRYAEEFFFGQSRLPCTYLDDYDFVFGASQKLEYVFGRVVDKGYRFLGVLNSPGAALIGDDLERYLTWAEIGIPALVVDKPDFSGSFEQGWGTAVRRVLEKLNPPLFPVRERCVNLVGVSVWHKNWQESVSSLKALLALCGISVQAVLCAGSNTDELSHLRAACCNVVVYDEMGREPGLWLESHYGMPLVRSPEGAPFGYEALEIWLKTVCVAVGANPEPGLTHIRAFRERTGRKLMDFHLQTGLPRGATFGVCLEASLAFAVVKCFHAYLGMVPLAVQVPDESEPFACDLRKYLEEGGFASAWNASMEPENPPDAVFSNDAVIQRLKSQGHLRAGVALAMPDEALTDFVSRTVLGPEGLLWALQDLSVGLWTLVE